MKSLFMKFTQATAQKRKEQRDHLDKFFTITSPDVDVVLFRTGVMQGFQMADRYSTYFGQGTEVYFIDTQSKNTHPQQFKARMDEDFKGTVNIWAVYDKEYLPAYIEYIIDTRAFKLYYDRKRTMWEKNKD